MARSALAQLEELRRDVQKTGDRITEIEAEKRRAPRLVDEAKQALANYYADLEAGRREVDGKEEAGLIKAREKADAMTDSAIREAEARMRGAVQLLGDRQNAVPQFIASRRDELEAEMIPQAEEARDGLLKAWEEFRAASGQWSQVRLSWLGLIEHWGISPLELPQHPALDTSGLDRGFAPYSNGKLRDPRRLWPMPINLVPGDFPEVDPTDDLMRAAP